MDSPSRKRKNLIVKEHPCSTASVMHIRRNVRLGPTLELPDFFLSPHEHSLCLPSFSACSVFDFGSGLEAPLFSGRNT